MAIESIFKPSSRGAILQNIQSLSTPAVPTEETIKLALSADPNGPSLTVPKSASKEDIQKVINSDEFINDMFSKGYLFTPGLDAEAIPLESLDDGAFTKQFKSGANFVKRVPANLMSIVGDVIDNKDMQQKWQDVVKQYQLKADAERFFVNDEGKLEAYDFDIFNILQSESKFKHFTDFVAGAAGNAVATSIPFFLLRYGPPAVGAVGGALLTRTPQGTIAGAKLFSKFGKYASNAYLAAMAGADLTESQLEVTDDPDLGITATLAPLYVGAEMALGAPINFSKIIGEATSENVGKYSLKKFVKDMAGIQLSEMGAEAIQETLVETAGTLEEGKRDGDITQALTDQANDPEFYKTIANAGAMGFFGGAPFGAAAGGYKYIISPGDLSKDFTGSVSNSNIRTTGADIDDIINKRVNVSTITNIADRNNETIKDKQGNPVVPEFIVAGIINMNGQDYYVLSNTQGGNQRLVPINQKPNISIVENPVEPTKEEVKNVNVSTETSRVPRGLVGVTQEQAELIALDVKRGMSIGDAIRKHAPGAALDMGTKPVKPEEVVDEFAQSDEETKAPVINTKTHQANERKLINRGYDLKNIRGKNEEGIYRDDVSSLVSDNLNEISSEEDNILEELGYYKGPNGQAYIDRLRQDIASKDAKTKTNGRKEIENIINKRIQYKPFTLEQMEKVGEETVAEPLTENELKKAGISLGIIDKYTMEELDQAINSTKDENQIKKLKAYKLLKSRKPADRLKALQNLITGKYSDIGPASSYNVTIDKFRDEIEKIKRSTFMTPEEKNIEIKGLEAKIDNIQDAKTYINELLITLGLDTLTNEDFNNLKSVPKDLKTKILGNKKAIKEKAYYRFWNKFHDITPYPPKLKQSVYDDLPSMEAEFRAYLLRTVGPNVDLKFVDDIKGADGFPGNGFFQFVGDYNLVDLGTKDAEVEILIAKNNIADPNAIGINTDPRLYTLHHEAMHALFTMLTDAQKAKLIEAAEKSWIKEFKIETRYKGMPRFIQQLEAISDRFAQYKANQYKPRGMIKTIFDTINKILKGIGRVLFNRNYQNVNDIFEEADLGILQKKYLARRLKELKTTKDLNYEQLTLLNRSAFQAWFKDSKVKGGTLNSMRIVGQGSNNANANLLIRERLNPSIENKFPAQQAEILDLQGRQFEGKTVGNAGQENINAEIVRLDQRINIFGDDDYADVRRIVLQSLSKMDLSTYAQVAKNLTDAGQDTLIYINEDQSVSALWEVDNADETRLEAVYNAIPVSIRKGLGIEKSTDNIPFGTSVPEISAQNDLMIKGYLTDIAMALNILTGYDGKKDGIPDYDNLYDFDRVVNRLRNTAKNNYDTIDLYFREDRRVRDIINFTEAYISTYLSTPAQNAILDLLIGQDNGLFTYGKPEGKGSFQEQFSMITATKLTESDIDRANSALVLFHGTTKDLQFIGNTIDLGAHVGTAGQADRIIRDLKEQGVTGFQTEANADKEAEYLNNAQVYPVMVSMQNPLRMPDLGNWLPDVVLETLSGDPNKFQIVQNPAATKIYDEKEAFPHTVYKPIFTKSEQRRISKAMEDKTVRQQYKILVSEIEKKGYDGIVYRNEFERDLALYDYYLYDSYIPFKPSQLKSVFNNGNFDPTTPNILESRSFTPDPSDPPLEQGQEPLNRQQQRRDFFQFSNKIDKVKGMFDKGGTQSIDKWSLRSKIFGHPRNWAIADEQFSFLFQLVRDKDRKQTEIVTEFTAILQDFFLPALGNKETNEALMKAMEISQQPVLERVVDPKTGEVSIVKRPPGIFRADENGEIVFVAQEDGRAAGSTVKKGETVILRGNAARAYEDAQKALAFLHGEVVRGLLSDENTRDLITNALRILRDYRPDIADNGIVDFNMPVEAQENLTYEQLSYVLEKLKEPNTLLQPNREPDVVLTKLIPTIVGKTRGTKTNPQGSGLSALVADLKQFEDFKKSDYVPLQRYGNYFISVKDRVSGDLVDYRQFNKGKFGTQFLNEEPQVREELQKKYGSDNYIISATEEVDIQELRKLVGDDFDSLDSIAQHLSDVNVEAYKELRKELDTLINKKVGRNIRGYSFYFKPRKEIGGVPGFSNDFGRALSQYAQAAAQAASSNRFNTSANRLLKNVTDRDKQPDAAKRKMYKKWFDYTSDPEQEFANLRRLGFWWYLGGNLSSAFLQLLSIVQITGPYISQFAGTAKTTKELSRAARDVGKLLTGKNKSYQDLFMDLRKENIPEDVREDFLAGIFNGVIKQGSAVRESGMPSGALNIKTRNNIRSGFRTVENTVIGGAFQTFETFARSTAYIAIHRLVQDPAVRKQIVEYLTENNALFRAQVAANGGIATPRIIAEELVEETFGLYNKINKPAIMRSYGAPIFLFQTYISQMMGIFLRLLTQGNRNRKNTGRKILSRMMLAVFLSAGFFGLPGGEDGAFLFDLFRKIYTGVDQDARKDFREMLNDLGTPKFLMEAAENGLINAVANVDLSKRIAFRLPGSDQARAALNILGAPVPQDLSAITGAPGAIFIDNSRKLFQELTQTGGISFDTYVDALLPTFLKNIYKGYKIGKDGRAYSSTGTLLTDDINALDTLWQTIGFTPTKIAKEREALRLEKFYGGETRMFRTRINNLLTEAYRNIMVGSETNNRNLIEKGNDQIDEALEKVLIFNSKMGPTYNFIPDMDALRTEALKDLYKEYRLSKTSLGQLVNNLAARENLGLD